MAKELTLYTNPMSRGRVARWMLEEIGAPYRTEFLEYDTTMKAPEYLAINPLGKVPAIRHGDTVVTESAAICAYMADAFPDVGLAPPLDQRGPYYRWLMFFAGPFEYAVYNKAMGWEAEKESEKRVGYGNFDHVMDAVEGALKKSKYIAGDRFTAADVFAGAHINWGVQFNTIDKRPVFEAYQSRIISRDAFKRAEEIDNAAMEKPGG